MIKEIENLSKEELIALQYFIIRNCYNKFETDGKNYHHFYKKLNQFKNQNNVEIDMIKVWIKNFGIYEEQIFSIIFGVNDNQLLDSLNGKDKQNLLNAINKLLIIFKENQTEYPEIYQRLIEVKSKLEIPSLESIFSSLTNPLENMELIRKLNEEIRTHGKVKIRKINLSTDKDRKREELTAEDRILLAKKYIMMTYEYYLNNYQNGDFTIIKNQSECMKIHNFVFNNLNKLAVVFSNAFNSKEDVNIQDICNEYNDETITRFIETLNSDFKFPVDDHYGKLPYTERMMPEYRDKSEGKGMTFYDARIYLNTPYSKEGFLFLMEYIKKCREYGIECNMKGMDKGAGYEGKDVTIFYSLISDLPLRIKILEEIKKEHPEWIPLFGSPPSGTALLNDSYYGICHTGTYIEDSQMEKIYGRPMCNCQETYNDYFNHLAMCAYYSTLAKYVVSTKLINEVDPRYKEALINYANLSNIKPSENIMKTIVSSRINNIPLSELGRYLDSNDFISKLQNLGFTLEDDAWLKNFQMRMQRLSNIAQKRRPDSMLSPAISNFIVKEIIKERELKKSNQMVDEETVGRAR